jgi:hypothetical protein
MLHYCSPQQRKIVLDDSKIKLINGCAGSRKTDTIIKIGIKEYNNNSKAQILFITMVSSVTNEIRKRLEKKLGIKFIKKGNHYINKNIEITNFDAMIHTQLLYQKDDIVFNAGSCYNKKVKHLYTKYISKKKHRDFINHNGKSVDVILIDEFQDIPNTKVKVLTGIIKNNKNIIAVAAGDYLQTIFEHAIMGIGKKSNIHPMRLWEKELDSIKFELNICFRCPQSHINFVNLLMNDFQKKLSITPVEGRANQAADLGHTPIMFYHPPLSHNHSAFITSNMIIDSLRTIRSFDSNFHPGDVAIIMTKSNNNPLYHQLEHNLNKFYTEIGFKNKVKLFETKRDGVHQTINWDGMSNRTVLLSVHGIKGKGYKIVFFLGLTEGALPNETHLFKHTELLDQSLLNVALTRSTKWLFVGFTKTMMSRYIKKYYDQLHKYCVLTWDNKTWNTNIYEQICTGINKHYHDIQPNGKKTPWLKNPNYKNEPVYRANKLVSSVKYDIATLYEHYRELDDQNYIGKPIIIKFGKRIKNDLEPKLLPIYGVMAEMILEREINLLAPCLDKYSFFIENDIYYTTDERLLNIVKDEQFNNKINMGLITKHNYKTHIKEILNKYSKYLRSYPSLKKEISDLLNLRKAKYIMPIIFQSKVFRDSVREFISTKKSSEIETSVFWNMALASSVIDDSGAQNRTSDLTLHMYMNWYAEDISDLLGNIANFIKLLKDDETVSFHQKYALVDRETDGDMLKTMGLSYSTKYGIIGESDMISSKRKELFEVKCPVSKNFAPRWTTQAVLYSCLYKLCSDETLGQNSLNYVSVVDLGNGFYYRYKLNSKFNEKRIIMGALNKLGHRNRHVKRLIDIAY